MAKEIIQSMNGTSEKPGSTNASVTTTNQTLEIRYQKGHCCLEATYLGRRGAVSDGKATNARQVLTYSLSKLYEGDESGKWFADLSSCLTEKGEYVDDIYVYNAHTAEFISGYMELMHIWLHQNAMAVNYWIEVEVGSKTYNTIEYREMVVHKGQLNGLYVRYVRAIRKDDDWHKRTTIERFSAIRKSVGRQRLC